MVSYLEQIWDPLTRTLEHTQGLPAHQLAGHAANIDFWVSEAVHCLMAIDGYYRRFKRMQEATRTFLQLHPADRVSPPARRSTKDHDLVQLRQRLLFAAERLLKRCLKEGFVDRASFVRYCAALGIEERSI